MQADCFVFPAEQEEAVVDVPAELVVELGDRLPRVGLRVLRNLAAI